MARIKAKPVYTEEFRNEALNMLRNSDRTIREVSLALGVSDWTLRTWYKLSEMARTSKKTKASPKPPPQGETPTEKIARLERELAASSATRHPHGATNRQDDGARWGNSTTEGSGVTPRVG